VQQALSAKLPLVKNLSHTLENLRFASALSILLANGVTLSDGLEHAIEAVSNKHIKKRLTSVKSRVRQGESLSETLASVGFLPAAFDGLVEVGEQTGDLKEIFQEMESRLKINYENQVAALITLIEPAMILLMGLIVGSIVVALLLSIVSVNDIVF
jgi:type II secretory pathway component PulF